MSSAFFNTSAYSATAPKAALMAHTGGSVDLEGGIARDAAGNLYITEDTSDTIIKVTPGGAITTLVTKAAIEAAKGATGVDLDTAVVLGDALFVNDDGGAGGDAILRVNIATGAVTVIAGEAAINAVTGNTNADLEGGIGLSPSGVLFVGDDGELNGQDRANILRVTAGGTVSLFVSDAQITAFYAPLYPGADPRLRGGLVIQRLLATSMPAPVLSLAGLVLVAMLMTALAWSRLPGADRSR